LVVRTFVRWCGIAASCVRERRLRSRVLRIALTGGIATGKSYALERLRRHGIPCIDSDELAHGVMAAGTEATAAVAARFGDVLAADGSVDRQKLGPIVFADADARRDLERIVHPAVYRAIAAALNGFEKFGDARFAVADIPLLYETGHEKDFDNVIATFCPEAIQRARLIERGLSADAADQRIAAQLPAAEKARRADFVVRTDGHFSDTDAQIDAIVQQLNRLVAERQ
jgi:dephospho-CoA kinase